MVTNKMLSEVIIARLHWLRNEAHYNASMSIDDFMSANWPVIHKIKESINKDYGIDMLQHTPEIRNGIRLYLIAEGIFKQ
ncbi:hypothetical protein CAP35_13655 [Chitinophagaceae bacterium IBVUCB1]|nr:hypothetical protein CAP35_13655 [Chitinophagaceae bacterium IBVUCB1]